MRKTTTLAVVISSMLLGAVAAQAEPGMDPSQNQQAQATSQTDTKRPDTTSAAPDADTATGTSSTGNASTDQNNDEASKNNDKASSSGSYYPYSAGTVGEDPSKPNSTSVAPDASGKASNDDNWKLADSDGDGSLSQEELTKVQPTLSASFSEMDVDGDKQVTRDEFRTWHESHKARMDADQGANPSRSPDSSSTGTTSTPDDNTSSSSTPPGNTGG